MLQKIFYGFINYLPNFLPFLVYFTYHSLLRQPRRDSTFKGCDIPRTHKAHQRPLPFHMPNHYHWACHFGILSYWWYDQWHLHQITHSYQVEKFCSLLGLPWSCVHLEGSVAISSCPWTVMPPYPVLSFTYLLLLHYLPPIVMRGLLF